MRCPRIPSACRTIRRPMPRPSHCAVSSRVNAWKILGICSSGIPMPVSYTSIRISEPKRLQPSSTRPPDLVYLTALLTRLRRAAPRSRPSLSTVASLETEQTLIPLLSAACSFSRHACRRTCWIRTGVSSRRPLRSARPPREASRSSDIAAIAQDDQSSELRCLRSSQTAIDRLKGQLEQIPKRSSWPPVLIVNQIRPY
jgi:hypothetical protein